MNYSQQAQDFPAHWSRLVSAGKFEEVLSLYHKNSILMPTFSPKIIKKREDLLDYFTRLAEREDMSVRLHENTVVCQRASLFDYVVLGIYSWEFKLEDNLLTFPSRFTYLLDFENDSPIMHHHSSQIPRTLG
jgi:hypothetical protein